VSGCAEGRLSIFRLEQRFAADDHYDADAQSHGLARDAMDVAHAELGGPVALLAACVAAGAGEVAVVGDAISTGGTIRPSLRAKASRTAADFSMRSAMRANGSI